VQVVGDPKIQAEAPLTLEGFRERVSGHWVITRVEHVLDSSGFLTDIEAEKTPTTKELEVKDLVD
jgi:uncharacterized protein